MRIVIGITLYAECISIPRHSGDPIYLVMRVQYANITHVQYDPSPPLYLCTHNGQFLGFCRAIKTF